MKILKQCPSCSQKEFTTHLNCKDHTVSKINFKLNKCKNCDLIFTNPRPKDQDLNKYYESEDYISHNSSKKGIFNYLYRFIRKITIKQKIKMLGSQKGLLLEIGSGTGDLLKACIEAGWDGIGIEPSAKARKVALKTHQLELHADIKGLQIQPKSVDYIMMWHVLEHVPHLKEMIKILKKYIKKDGKIIIAAPNCASLDAKIYKEHWAAYDVPRHLSHFQKGSMEKLLGQFEMKVVKYKPMLFDSYYISMLSEKNKNGKIKFIKSGLIGMLSNLNAMIINKEYSSLIYMIKENKAV